MNSIDRETINFVVKTIAVVIGGFALMVSPAAGLAIFHRMAVRLGLPTIVEELLKFGPFKEYVDSRCKHAVNNNDAKLDGLYSLIKDLTGKIETMGLDIAVLKERTKGEHHA